MCVSVRVVYWQPSNSSNQIHSPHTHTHGQYQRTDSSMKASSTSCRRRRRRRRSSLPLALSCCKLLAATKTAKKMFAPLPLPTALCGKVFNLLHMHKQNESVQSETDETGEAGEAGETGAPCKLLLLPLRRCEASGNLHACMLAALSSTHSHSRSRSAHCTHSPGLHSLSALAHTLSSCPLTHSSSKAARLARAKARPPGLPFSLTLLELPASLINELLSRERESGRAAMPYNRACTVGACACFCSATKYDI